MADPKPNILQSIVDGTYDPIGLNSSTPSPLGPVDAGSSVPSPLLPAISKPTLGTQDQLTAPAQDAQPEAASGGSWSADGKTLTLPPRTQDNSSEPLAPEEHVGILKTIGRLAGGAFGLTNPNSSPQAAMGARIGALAGRTGNALAEAAGTPEQKQLAEERNQMPLKLAQIQGMLSINQQNANTKKQVAETGARTEQDKYATGDANTPEGTARQMAAVAQQNADSNEALRAAHQKQIEAQLNGKIHVTPEAANAAGDKSLANTDLPAIEYMQRITNPIKNQLAASGGTKTVDLGNDGVYGYNALTKELTRLGDSPSVARAGMVLNRPVQAFNPQTGRIEWMRGGDAIAQGAAPAAPAQQIMSKQAQFSDIYSGLGSMRSAVNEMAQEGGPTLSAPVIAKLVMATRETDPTIAKEAFDTILGSEQLTPAQQDFVIATQQLNERALSLRNLAGMGNASDSMRAAIRATLPSAKSGDVSMMRKQLDAVTNLVDNLHTGVPNINTGAGNPPAPKKRTTVPNSGTVVEYVRGADGKLHPKGQ